MDAPEANNHHPAPGLYVHVPFCSAICSYCNFTRGLFDEAVKRRFIDALLGDIRAQGSAAQAGSPADTLYFGGGTPSLLTPVEVGAIVACSRDAFGLVADAEITLEANPESVTRELLDGFRAAGVGRLSFGVQSFSDAELQRLGRVHSAARAEEALHMARGAGFDNVSLDLMMGLPGQGTNDWAASVKTAIGLRPDHLSLYILEIYPHLPLRLEMNRHAWAEPPEDAVVAMYLSAMTALDSAGYRQYEISNVSRPGYESRHNVKYWTDGEWWGFGPAAHSTVGSIRRRNVTSTDEYVNRVTAGAPVFAEERRLSPEEKLGDALFTGLRVSDGVDLALLSTRYGRDVWREFERRLTPYLEAGILLRQDTRLRLTRSGMLLANEVMSVFV